jgi:8-oxo-dGTP pyrophosphatase MutT (NUDIX family)
MKEEKRSAGIVVTRRIAGDTGYLLLRCYRYWDFPKGEVEPGEEQLQAACRETEEETGLTDLRFPWSEVYTETPVYAGGKVARYYLAESQNGDVRLPISPELGKPEHQEYRWVRYEEARTLLNDRVRAVLDWARERIVTQG